MMINFATLVSRATGFTPPDGSSAPASGEAAGGEFASLVRLAGGAVDGSAMDLSANGLRMAVNNDAAAAHTVLAVAAGEQGHLTHANSELISFVTGQDIILPPPTKDALVTVPSVPQADKGTEQAIVKAQTAANFAAPVAPSTSNMALTQVAGDQDEAPVDADASEEAPAEELAEAAAQPEVPAMPTNGPLAAPVVTVAPVVVTSNFRAAASTSRGTNAAPTLAERHMSEGRGDATQAGDAEVTEFAQLADKAQSTARSPAAESLQIAATPRAGTEAPIPVMQLDGAAPALRGAAGIQGPSTAEALGSQVIDMGVSGQWIDRLSREIAGVIEGSGHSRFTLNPPHLGRLQVEILQTAEMTDVRLFTETDEATQRLNEGRNALQADARAAAINLGQITVEKSSAAFESGTRDQGQNQRDLAGQMQQQQERQANGRGAQNERDGWNGRARADQSDHSESDIATRAARQARADGNVRFA